MRASCRSRPDRAFKALDQTNGHMPGYESPETPERSSSAGWCAFQRQWRRPLARRSCHRRCPGLGGTPQRRARLGQLTLEPMTRVLAAWSGSQIAPSSATVVRPRSSPKRSAANPPTGVEVSDLVDALGELPAVRGGPGSGRGIRRSSAPTCRRGSARALRCMRGRTRCRPQAGSWPGAWFARSSPQTLRPLDPGADLLPASELGVEVEDPHRAVGCEQRCQAVVVAHHDRVGELAAQRLDLKAISGGRTSGIPARNSSRSWLT